MGLSVSFKRFSSFLSSFSSLYYLLSESFSINPAFCPGYTWVPPKTSLEGNPMSLSAAFKSFLVLLSSFSSLVSWLIPYYFFSPFSCPCFTISPKNLAGGNPMSLPVSAKYVFVILFFSFRCLFVILFLILPTYLPPTLYLCPLGKKSGGNPMSFSVACKSFTFIFSSSPFVESSFSCSYYFLPACFSTKDFETRGLHSSYLLMFLQVLKRFG